MDAQTWLDPATACVPTWACDEDYYHALVRHERVYIKTDPIKGKGLFARGAISEGDRVLVETALCCSQNVDDFEAGVPICGNCMASVESPKAIVRRVAGKEAAAQLPKSAGGTFKARAVVPCRCSANGCTMVFCSHRCADDAWRRHHYVGCAGVMSDDARAAYDAFRTDGWVHNGVDLSDTAFLAFRFLCFVLTRHRLHRLPLPTAFFPVGQLIRTHISRFTFSYLLQDEYEEACDKKALADGGDSNKAAMEAAAAAAPRVPFNKMSDAERKAARWRLFAQHTGDPSKHPAVLHHLDKEDPRKEGFVRRGITLVRRAVMATDAEAAFLTDDMWANLLGAVLLNGQERSPNSQFVDFMRSWKQQPNSDAAIKAFGRFIRENCTGSSSGGALTPKDFDTSTRGQGIYTVGSCFNHSCRPNLQIHYAGDDDEMLCAVALRDIAADEELYISYIDEDLPLPQRQQQLFEHYLFTCACEKCEEDKAKRRVAADDAGDAGASPAAAASA
jgi:hypothetical protein